MDIAILVVTLVVMIGLLLWIALWLGQRDARVSTRVCRSRDGHPTHRLGDSRPPRRASGGSRPRHRLGAPVPDLAADHPRSVHPSTDDDDLLAVASAVGVTSEDSSNPDPVVCEPSSCDSTSPASTDSGSSS